MNPEQNSAIAVHPFIRHFVFSIISTIRAQNLDYIQKDFVHADLVPKVSEKVMQASLKERVVPPMTRPPILETPPKQFFQPTIQRPAPPMKVPQRVMSPRRMVPQQVPARTFVPRAESHLPQTIVGSPQEYGRITPLLNDPSVFSIECPGAKKPVMILRGGQRQITRIELSDKEIKEILDKISDEVHIPLLEGVFRATLEKFSINAVISEMIGSRFIIKKMIHQGFGR